MCLNGLPAECKPVAELASEGLLLGQVSSDQSDLTASVVIDAASLAKGQTLTRLVTLGNSGNASFPAGYRVKSVRMKYSPSSLEEGDVNSLECWSADGTKRCEQMDSLWRLIVPKGFLPQAGQTTMESFAVKFTAFDNKPRNGLVRIELQGIGASTLTFNLNIATLSGSPKGTLAPKDISFPYVPPKQCATETVQLLNTGEAVLAIDSVDMVAIDNSFQMRLTAPTGVDTQWHDGAAVWSLAKQLQVPSKRSAEFEVKFCPVSNNKKQGQVKFVGNDSSPPTLSILANSSVPCIIVGPTSLDFGGAIPGSQGSLDFVVTNCGSQELVITELKLTEDASDAYQEFFIDLAELANSGKLKAPPPLSAENPLKLGINEQAAIPVRYAPANVPPSGAKDTGEIKVHSSAYIVPTVKLQGI